MVNDETGEIIAWHGDPDPLSGMEVKIQVFIHTSQHFGLEGRKNGYMEEIEVSESAITGGVKIDEFLFATFAMDWQTITLRDESGTKSVEEVMLVLLPDSLYVG